MSIKVMSWIWETSASEGRELLVELALGDFADDDGVCWPAIETIARKARCSIRHAQTVIRQRERDGRLRIDIGKGPHGTNRYQFLGVGERGATIAGSEVAAPPQRLRGAKPDPEIAPDPSGTVTKPVDPSGLDDAAPVAQDGSTPLSPPVVSANVASATPAPGYSDGNLKRVDSGDYWRERRRRRLQSELAAAEATANNARYRYEIAWQGTGKTERQAQVVQRVKTAKQALDIADAAYAAAAKAVRDFDREPEEPVPKAPPVLPGGFVDRAAKRLG